MKLNDIRVGNIVKEFLYSSRDRALLPFYRVEYHDLGYPQFMEGIPITLEWCKYLKMEIETPIPHATYANFDWIAKSAGLKVKSFKGDTTVFHTTSGVSSIMDHIKYVHQLQNFYYGYWGFEIDEENSTEFYK